MEEGLPFRWDRRGSSAGSPQSAGDGRGGVGVVTRTHAVLQRLGQIAGSPGQRPPGGLQRMHHPTVVGKVCRRTVFGDVEQRSPIRTDRCRRLLKIDPHPVRRPGEYRVPDCTTPHLTRFSCASVVMREIADGTRGAHTTPGVVEKRQGHWRRTHQGTVATGASGQARSPVSHRACRSTPAAQHRPGLRTDIRWAGVVPAHKRPGDRIEIGIAFGQSVGHANRHRRVVGPLTGVPVERPAAFHPDLGVRRGVGELVARAECVSCCRPEQDPQGPVELLVIENHRFSLDQS